MSQRTVPAPFLTKTYQLVDDRSTDEVVSWNDGGTTFVVWKTAEFAKDLLPIYFKHNNFSSFIRQLNTYGFRKTVPDKWEFANENFKRGQKELLVQIRRRKTTTLGSSQAAGKAITTVGDPSSPANSRDDFGSTSTSSPDSKNPGSVEAPSKLQFTDLSDENGRLRKDNQMLSSELAKTKKQCDELISFLTRHVKVQPDQIDRIMSHGATSAEVFDCGVNAGIDDDDDDDDKVECLKLFGVVLKDKKRKRDEKGDLGFPGANLQDSKIFDFTDPWMKISSMPGKSCKMCN